MADRRSADSPPPPVPVAAMVQPSRGPLVIAAAVVVGAVLIASAIWVTRGDDQPTTTASGAGALETIVAQREQGYVADLQSTLKNAATAMESYAAWTSPPGDYSGATVGALVEQGLVIPGEVTLTTTSTYDSYCITATHDYLSEDHGWKTATFDSELGTPSDRDACS